MIALDTLTIFGIVTVAVMAVILMSFCLSDSADDSFGN